MFTSTFSQRIIFVAPAIGAVLAFCLVCPSALATRPATGDGAPPGLNEKQRESLFAWREKVYALGNAEKWDEALLMSDKLIRQYPDDVIMRRYRAEIFGGLEMPHKAIAECNIGLRIPAALGGEDIHLLLFKAKMQLMQNECDAALRTLSLIDGGRNIVLIGNMHYLKSEIFQKQGKLAEAKRELQETMYAWTINDGPRKWTGELANRARELGVSLEDPILPRRENAKQLIVDLLKTACAANPVPTGLESLPGSANFHLAKELKESGLVRYVGAPDLYRKKIVYTTYTGRKYGSTISIEYDTLQTIVTESEVESAISAMPESLRPVRQNTDNNSIHRYTGSTYTLDLSFGYSGFKALTGATIFWTGPRKVSFRM